MYRKIIAVLCAIMVVGAVTGCNTVRGVGQDVEAGGKAISKAAS
ncbi:hypothetical protein GCM10023211_15220 [Orbus sasakiae]|uniref:Uncharacterized protein n=1 Tax=Orbus sasakiae TaxID=1078475 RepID=A0ABP9NCU7_9GAMM